MTCSAKRDVATVTANKVISADLTGKGQGRMGGSRREEEGRVMEGGAGAGGRGRGRREV